MAETNFPKPELILLDVYETLLDMSEVERRINSLLDSKRGYQIWFELFMQYCFVDNLTQQFNDFPSIAIATMKMAGQSLGRIPEDDDMDYVLEHLRHLPVNHGVQPGLSRLYDKGYRIAALTNSPESTVRDRMEFSGLVSYFEEVLSAEHVKKYKPSVEVYHWAAKKLKLEPAQIMMVSAHGWDITGAANAGMQTAYLQIRNQMLYPLAPQPQLVIKGLEELGEVL